MYRISQSNKLIWVTRGETQLTSELSKAGKPYRSVKGRTRTASYVLRILDERAREGSLPGWGGEVFSEIKYVTRPTLSLAWYLPNNFEAEWQGLRVRFRVERFKEGKFSRWGVASYSVEPMKESKSLGKVEHLPLDTFLKEAIHLATVQCITYPPGFEGAMLGVNGEPLSGWRGFTVSVAASRKEGESYPVAWRTDTPRDILREFVATATDSSKQKKLSHEKRLTIVAKAWRKADTREKAIRVQEALAEAGDPVSIHRVKQLIREAREAGKIPKSTRSKK